MSSKLTAPKRKLAMADIFQGLREEEVSRLYETAEAANACAVQYLPGFSKTRRNAHGDIHADTKPVDYLNIRFAFLSLDSLDHISSEEIPDRFRNHQHRDPSSERPTSQTSDDTPLRTRTTQRSSVHNRGRRERRVALGDIFRDIQSSKNRK